MPFNRADATAANAFFWSDVDLTAYLGTNYGSTPYLVTLTDSGGKVAVGYIGGPGTGEHLDGTERVTGWTNGATPYVAYNTFAATGKNITGAVKSSGAGRSSAHSNTLGMTTGWLYKAVLQPVINSGSGMFVRSKQVGGASGTTGGLAVEPLTVDTTVYATVVATYDGMIVATSGSGVNVDFALTPSIQRVNEPPATGVHVFSTPNGTTRGWASIQSGFLWNAIVSAVVTANTSYSQQAPWDFQTPGSYTYDISKIEFLAGQAQLKATNLAYSSIYGLVKCAPWTRYAGNPILSKSATGWDSYGLRDPMLLVDTSGSLVKEDGKHIMYYRGMQDLGGGSLLRQMGRATSPDGITWTKDTANNPILAKGASGQWDDFGIGSMWVIKRGTGDYYAVYEGMRSDLISQIGVATSTDGIHWTRYASNPVLTQTDFAGITVETMAIVSGIIASNGTYALYFETGLPAMSIFGATSSDGLAWTPMNSGQAVLAPSAGSWDSARCANPKPIEISAGHYILGYNGTGVSASEQIGFAYGTDLVNWTKYSENPVMLISADGQWDDSRVENAFIVKDDIGAATLRMWYFGCPTLSGTLDAAIGYATCDQNAIRTTGLTYPTDNPAIIPTVAGYQPISDLVSFVETATKHGGEIKYQLSNDGGATWYWYNSGWTATTAGYTEANAASGINTNIPTFPTFQQELPSYSQRRTHRLLRLFHQRMHH